MPNHNLRGEHMRVITIVLLALLSLFANIAYAVGNSDNTKITSKHYLISSKTGSVPSDIVPAKAVPFLHSHHVVGSSTLIRRIRWRDRNVMMICTGPTRVMLYPGSLKNNIQRIAGHCGWEMVWNPPCDYRWFGVTQISGMDLRDVFRKMLKNYPVQAVFYQGNRILAIGPRNLP
jgi:hypothetical protein